MKKKYQKYFFPTVILISSLSLFLTSLYSFLLFHTLVELFTVVVSFGIFVIAWSSRKYANNEFLLIIGIAYLFVGGFDLIHALTYKGLNIIFGYGSNLPTQLWVAARYFESVSFVVALLFFKSDFENRDFFLEKKYHKTFGVFLVVFIVVIFSIFFGSIFPDAYIDGFGLTSFKIYSEYLISLFFVISFFILLKKRKFFDREMADLLLISFVVKIFSEVAFVYYVGVYDFANIMGHILRFISSLLLYKAVLEIGLMKPYYSMFLALREGEKLLRGKIEDKLAESYRYLGIVNRKISLLLDLDEHPQGKKNQKQIADYILNSAVNLSQAEKGLLYVSNNAKKFKLISVNGIDREKLEKLEFVEENDADFIVDLKNNGRRTTALCSNGKCCWLKKNIVDVDCDYFVALPFMVKKNCKGFLILGFMNRTSTEKQELDFLDIFSKHASIALDNSGIFNANSLGKTVQTW